MKGGPIVRFLACLSSLGALLLVSAANDPAPGTTYEGPLEGMVFALIPAGTFTIGSPEADPNAEPDERPPQEIMISEFQMMTTEVTQAMWLSVMGANPSHFSGNLSKPVEMVSWDDCRQFVDSLNALDDGYTYRLPSEAEWEYACRAGTTTRFYWGDIDGEWMAGRYCWLGGNAEQTTHPVGGKLPNAWGLCDMMGNVTEWCQDWYHEDYEGIPLDGSARDSGGGTYRVMRGACWTGTVPACRSAHRDDCARDHRLNYVGLRLARS